MPRLDIRALMSRPAPSSILRDTRVAAVLGPRTPGSMPRSSRHCSRRVLSIERRRARGAFDEHPRPQEDFGDSLKLALGPHCGGLSKDRIGSWRRLFVTPVTDPHVIAGASGEVRLSTWWPDHGTSCRLETRRIRRSPPGLRGGARRHWPAARPVSGHQVIPRAGWTLRMYRTGDQGRSPSSRSASGWIRSSATHRRAGTCGSHGQGTACP